MKKLFNYKELSTCYLPRKCELETDLFPCIGKISTMTFRERDQLCFRLVLGISRENNDNNAIMRDWCGNGSKIRGRPGLLYFGGGGQTFRESLLGDY